MFDAANIDFLHRYSYSNSLTWQTFVNNLRFRFVCSTFFARIFEIHSNTSSLCVSGIWCKWNRNVITYERFYYFFWIDRHTARVWCKYQAYFFYFVPIMNHDYCPYALLSPYSLSSQPFRQLVCVCLLKMIIMKMKWKNRDNHSESKTT